MKSHMLKKWSVFNILVVFQLILNVLQLNLLKLVIFILFYWPKNSKINKTSCQKFFFEKISTQKEQKWIVLNPCLDSLWNSAFKNIGLSPGVDFSRPSGCNETFINSVTKTVSDTIEENNLDSTEDVTRFYQMEPI